MSTPSLQSDLEVVRAVCQRVLELHGKATAGMWQYDIYNTIFAGSEQTGDLVEVCAIPDEPETGESKRRTRDEWYPESATNAELIAFYRSACPIAAGLLLTLCEGQWHTARELDAIHGAAESYREMGMVG